MEFNLFMTDNADYCVCKNGTIYSKYNLKVPLSTSIIEGFNKVRYTVGTGQKRITKYFRVDYLVASTYLCNPHGYRYINHKDGNNLNDNLDNLEWKQYCVDEPAKVIEGYNNKYIVTSSGKVFNNFTGKELKPKIVLGGYKAIALRVYENNKSRQTGYKIHRLVAEAFIPNPKKLPVVNHIDGNKLNNDVSNLEWCTFKDNTLHAIRTGLINTYFNKHNGQCIIDLIEKYGYNYSDISKLTGINRHTIAWFYQRGYKSYNLTSNNIHVKKHSIKNELPEDFINRYKDILIG